MTKQNLDVLQPLIRKAWEDEQFAELLRTQPRLAISQEIGLEVPAEIEIQVHQETPQSLHLVIPQKPINNERVENLEWDMRPYAGTTPDGSACATLGCKCGEEMSNVF